jgi:hypothetical protein
VKVVQEARLRPVDAGRLDNARLLERLTAFQAEVDQRYGLGGHIAIKVLPAELAESRAVAAPGRSGPG